MKMATDKKSFVLYADLITNIDHLTNEEKGILFNHLLEYVNDMNPVLTDRVVLSAWKFIQSQLKRDLRKFEDVKVKRSDAGKESARLRALNKEEQNPTKSTSVECVQQTLTNPTDNVNENVNVNVNDINNKSIKTLKVFKQEILDCYDSCINYFPDDLVPKGQKEIYNWLDAIEKLNRLDKWKFEDITAIVAKTREDPFWQKNFLSIAKLRTKDKEGLQYINVFYNKFRIDLNSKNNENKRQYIAELTKRYPNI